MTRFGTYLGLAFIGSILGALVGAAFGNYRAGVPIGGAVALTAYLMVQLRRPNA